MTGWLSEPDDGLRRAVADLLSRHPDGLLPIAEAGEPVLRRQALPYTGQLGDLLPPLLEAMRATMLDAPGVGLAAPQIGLALAIAVVEDAGAGPQDPRERLPLPYRVLVNPVYAKAGRDHASFYEGCLSFPGYQAVRRRWRAIRLTGQDECARPIDEELTGWPARIVQHETDHLRGELYIDRAELRSLASNAVLARDPAQTEPR